MALCDKRSTEVKWFIPTCMAAFLVSCEVFNVQNLSVEEVKAFRATRYPTKAADFECGYAIKTDMWSCTFYDYSCIDCKIYVGVFDEVPPRFNPYGRMKSHNK